MPKQLQLVFSETEKIKQEIKGFRTMFKEHLEGLPEYVELDEKIKVLREKKKQIIAVAKEGFANEFGKLDDLLIDLKSEKEMLNDAAITKLMAGETVEVVDQYNNTYEPVFKVTFKKG